MSTLFTPIWKLFFTPGWLIFVMGDFMSVFAERVRELRGRLRLNQTDFGAKIGVSQQVIHKWEAGRTKPDPETVSRLAAAYAVTTDWLLGIVDVPNIYKHTVSLPDGREGYLLDMIEASPSEVELAGFLEFLRSNPSLPPSRFPDEYKPLVQFVKAVLLESLQGKL